MATAPKTHKPAGYSRKAYDKAAHRREAHRFYNGDLWRRLRSYKLAHSPLCEECMRQGRDTIATVVDHIRSRVKNPELSYSEDNLQSLCVSCHNRKTRGEQRGDRLP